MNQVFDIPKHLRVGVLIMGYFKFWHFGLVIGYVTLILYTQDYIPMAWRIPTYLTGLVFIVFWIINSGQNPGKIKLQTLYYLLIRDRTVYHPISFKRKVDALSLDNLSRERK